VPMLFCRCGPIERLFDSFSVLRRKRFCLALFVFDRSKQREDVAIHLSNKKKSEANLRSSFKWKKEKKKFVVSYRFNLIVVSAK
jgi:hypothetical protein